jgi:hypothetical protein
MLEIHFITLLIPRLHLKGAMPLDVRGSVYNSTIHKEKIQQDATIYQNFIIPYLYEAQHVSGYSVPDNVHQQHVQQSSTYEKPEAASAILRS